MSIYQILESREISKFEFEQALSISEYGSFQIHFKREPNSCFVNNSFSDQLLALEANNGHITCLQSVQSCSIYVCIPIKD